jgi:hypothetical protein
MRDARMPPTDDLHPYDGQERSFRHDDPEPSWRAQGRALVARLLALPEPPAPEGLRYELRYYSGGIGVQDFIHVALPASRVEVDAAVARLRLVTPEAAAADAESGQDILGVMQGGDNARSLGEGVDEFVEDNRASFQPSRGADDRVWVALPFSPNFWTVVYEVGGDLCLMAFDQG